MVLSFRHSGKLGRKIAIWIPSLGQQSTMWHEISTSLENYSHVFVELPGHGDNPPATEAFTLNDLAQECLDYLKHEAKAWDHLLVVGLSIGGATALELAKSLPSGAAAVVMGAGANMGDPKIWQGRADLARSSGTEVMKDSARARWFTDAFVSSNPDEINRALESLGSVDGESYALCAEALGDFDVTQTAQDISIPVLVIAASQDEVAPPEQGHTLSKLIPAGEFFEIPAARHLFPIEESKAVTAQILGFLARTS